MSSSTYWRSKQGGTAYMSTCHTRFKCNILNPSGKKNKKTISLRLKIAFQRETFMIKIKIMKNNKMYIKIYQVLMNKTCRKTQKIKM